MPGPKSNRNSAAGPRPDPNGHERKSNRKASARLKARQQSLADAKGKFEHGFAMHVPGSQNRKK